MEKYTEAFCSIIGDKVSIMQMCKLPLTCRSWKIKPVMQ